MDGVVKTEDTKCTPLTLVDYMMLKYPDAYEAWLSDNTVASGEQWPTTIRWKAGRPDLCYEKGDASGNRNTEALAEHDPLETMIDNAVREAVAKVNEWKIALAWARTDARKAHEHHGIHLESGLYRLVKVNDDNGKQEL